MREMPPIEPQTPEEWEDEVHFTKVRDRLVLLRNRSQKKFDSALTNVQETDAFIAVASIPLFVLQDSEVARKFVEAIGADYDQLVSKDDVDLGQFM